MGQQDFIDYSLGSPYIGYKNALQYGLEILVLRLWLLTPESNKMEIRLTDISKLFLYSAMGTIAGLFIERSNKSQLNQIQRMLQDNPDLNNRRLYINKDIPIRNFIKIACFFTIFLDFSYLFFSYLSLNNYRTSDIWDNNDPMNTAPEF